MANTLSRIFTALIAWLLVAEFGRFDLAAILVLPIACLELCLRAPLRWAVAFGFTGTVIQCSIACPVAYRYWMAFASAALVPSTMVVWSTSIIFRPAILVRFALAGALITSCFAPGGETIKWAACVLAGTLFPLIPGWSSGLARQREFGVGLLALALVSLTVATIVCGTWVSSASTLRTAFVQQGIWARADSPIWNESNPDINHAYGYSELASKTGAEVFDGLESLGKLDNWDRILLITPTIPIDLELRDELLAWVHRGGFLFVCADHTDIYGHARVVNQLLAPAGLSSSLTSFFPVEPWGTAQRFVGTSLELKTSTTLRGAFAFGWLSADWTEEDPCYSGRNFFGETRESVDDTRGRQALGLSVGFGKGQVSLLADSTPLANFAINQPDSVELLGSALIWRASRWLWPSLLFVLALVPIAALCRVRLGFVVLGHASVALMFGMLGDFLVRPSFKVLEGEVAIAGNRLAWSEFSKDDESMSTALSLLPAWGVRPRWVDDCSGIPFGVWIGSTDQAPPGWKCLDRASNRITALPLTGGPLEPLLSRVSSSLTPELPSFDWNSRVVNPAGLWTNLECGDWWLERGCSPHRLCRVASLARWIRSGDLLGEWNCPRAVEVSDAIHPYLLRVDGRAPETILLPLEIPDKDGPLYLGLGVSCEVVSSRGRRVLYGTRAMQESMKSPSEWVLEPE